MGIKPSIIWGLDFARGKADPCADGDAVACAPGTCEFRWLHLNLADQWTRQWIERAGELPPDLREMLLEPETHQRAVVEDGYVGCVLHDVERDFDRLDAERTGVLRIALGPRLIVTARLHPVRSADIVRRRIDRGDAQIHDAADALDLVVSGIVETVEEVAGEQARLIEAFEDRLLDNAEGFDHRRLIGIRRRVVQFHRSLSGMRGVFRRLEQDPALPPALAPTVSQLVQRLGAIDAEMMGVQAQLRMLREEADLQAAQRTNQNLYVLSILTAALLPATLVTGFFGMNTGGLPWAHTQAGTVVAGLIMVASSAGVYLLLRWLGLHRT